MKKWLLIISATVICVAAAFLYFFSLTPKGDTITSRESILNTAISKIYMKKQKKQYIQKDQHS